MKALVLDGGAAGDELTAAAVRRLQASLAEGGLDVETMTTRDMKVAACRGCFGCWVRTPGECVIDDDAREIVRSYVAADVCVYVTPVTFGGYSSLLKTALDRIIPVLDPRFTTHAGEVHHRLRYARYPKLIVLGTMPEPDREAEAIFRGLVARNGLNMHNEPAVEVAAGEQAIEVAATRLLNESGVAA